MQVVATVSNEVVEKDDMLDDVPVAQKVVVMGLRLALRSGSTAVATTAVERVAKWVVVTVDK